VTYQPQGKRNKKENTSGLSEMLQGVVDVEQLFIPNLFTPRSLGYPTTTL
jgi:hypothetical protein